MSDEHLSAPGRRLLAIGAVGFALMIVVLTFMLLGAQSLQVTRLYPTDDETGDLTRSPLEYRWIPSVGIAR